VGSAELQVQVYAVCRTQGHMRGYEVIRSDTCPKSAGRPLVMMIRTEQDGAAEKGHRLGEPSPNVRLGLTLAFCQHLSVSMSVSISIPFGNVVYTPGFHCGPSTNGQATQALQPPLLIPYPIDGKTRDPTCSPYSLNMPSADRVPTCPYRGVLRAGFVRPNPHTKGRLPTLPTTVP